MNNFIGEYDISLPLCDDLIEFFNNSKKLGYTGLGLVGNGALKKSVKSCEELTIENKNDVYPFNEFMDELQYCHIENYKQPTFETGVSCNDYGTYQGSAANHAKVIENIINVILHNGKIATSGEEGSKIVEIIEKIYSFRKKLKK